jgi:hypothetical protein
MCGAFQKSPVKLTPFRVESNDHGQALRHMCSSNKRGEKVITTISHLQHIWKLWYNCDRVVSRAQLWEIPNPFIYFQFLRARRITKWTCTCSRTGSTRGSRTNTWPGQWIWTTRSWCSASGSPRWTFTLCALLSLIYNAFCSSEKHAQQTFVDAVRTEHKHTTERERVTLSGRLFYDRSSLQTPSTQSSNTSRCQMFSSGSLRTAKFSTCSGMREHKKAKSAFGILLFLSSLL